MRSVAGTTRPTAARQFRPEDRRLLGGLTPIDLIAEFAKLAIGGAGGFTLSFVLWVYLPTQAILLLPMLGLVTALGAALRRKQRAKAAGTGWLLGVTVTVVGAALALHTAYYW